MGPTGRTYRVVQVHPTRRCNLRCLHCYSSSGPEESEELPLDLLRQAMTDAADLGYNAMGVSGGEPLVYRPLRALLEHARSLGMITTVTSNGMLLDERRLAALQGVTSLLAISLDGVPASHDRMRNSELAFDTMVRRLAGVRESGVPFGFIFTLTLHNLHELDWVAAFAAEQGAGLLQVHPLEIVGRAERELSGARPDHVESVFAWLEIDRLRAKYHGRLPIQLDLAPREALEDAPERVFADGDPGILSERPFAEAVSPLVIEPNGEVMPVGFGLPRRFSLGNLYRGPLAEQAAAWRREREPLFRALCRSVQEEATAPGAPLILNWYEALHQRAEAFGA